MSDNQKYAIVKSGGKQYKAVAGKKIIVDKINSDVGESLTLDSVVAVSDGTEFKAGTPLISGVSVKAKVLGHKKSDKIIVFKKKRTTGYTKKQGHRQERTELLIDSIQGL